MKKLLLILFLTAFCTATFGQAPGGKPYPGNVVAKRIYTVTLVGIDTTTVPYVTNGKIYIDQGDTLVLGSGQKLYQLPDTVPIYNALTYKIDSVRKSNDSVFYYANGSLRFTTVQTTHTLQQVLDAGNTSTTGAFINAATAIGTTSMSSSSALFEVSSTTKGVLPARMTTAQRLAIVSPAQGLEVYDITVGAKYIFDNANWYQQ